MNYEVLGGQGLGLTELIDLAPVPSVIKTT